MSRLALLAVVLLAGGAAFVGIQAAGDDSGPTGGAEAKQQGSGDGAAGGGQSQGSEPGGGQSDGAGGDGPDADGGDPVAQPELPESSCPPDLSNCVVASGRVIYVEAVDPDGDGDAHFVTTSAEGVTFPGITVFDVRKDLRPEPLPGVGDLIGGAGPVFTGSRGQKQIEVIEFHVAR